MVVINLEDKYWPAYYRLAKALCCKNIVLQRQRKPMSFFVFLCICLKDISIKNKLKLFSALNEYWECLYYLKFLLSRARMIENPENANLIAHIIQHCSKDLAFVQRKAWGELVALAYQKLLHVVYYEKADAFKADVEAL